jgi:DNA gyrase subunit A
LEIGTVRPVKIEEQMREAYLEYAMSDMVRSLPDVRDGLKPVHRRILYTMHELGLRPDVAFRKCAGIVGETLGKYHPHGEAPVYEALVRMAQPFTMRYPLVDGQGNFGSIDDDPPAAMRYTEARMTAIATEMLADIEKETVDFVDNYDGRLKEPTVLPTRLPNLLVNGASGIAVAMATNIPPHNLREIVDALIYLIDKPSATVDELCNIVLGPDFPTAGIVLGRDAIKHVYATGHGRILMRARAHIEEQRGERRQIVITELPYQVNKAALIQRIAMLVRDRRIEGIADLRDESDRQGIRVVVEVKREADARKVLNQLYKHTPMQSAFNVNMLAMVDGQPRVLTLKMALQHFIDYRKEVVIRCTRFELRKARERAHILEGLRIALDNLDEVISIIRSSRTTETAQANLIKRFRFSEEQARAILALELRRLVALERRKIEEEYEQLVKEIKRLEEILSSEKLVLAVIKQELQELREKYGDDRRTRLVDQEAEEFTEEDLVDDQEVLVTISTRGYIKRLPEEVYRSSRRGMKSALGIGSREEAVERLLLSNTHDTLVLFSNRGRAFRLKTTEVPDGTRQPRGVPLNTLIGLEAEERIIGGVSVRSFEDAEAVLLATRCGEVKRVTLTEFATTRASGVTAIALEPGDELVWAALSDGGAEILLATREGQTIRFSEQELRASGRGSGGVRGIRLEEGDVVVSGDLVIAGGEIVAVTVLGAGRRTPESDFPAQGRGGGGVRALRITAKTGPLVALRAVPPGDATLVVLTQNGEAERVPLGSIKSGGRAVAPAPLIEVGKGDAVTDVAYLGGPAELSPTNGPSTSSHSRSGSEVGEEEAPTGSGNTRRRSQGSGSARGGAKPAARRASKDPGKTST